MLYIQEEYMYYLRSGFSVFLLWRPTASSTVDLGFSKARRLQIRTIGNLEKPAYLLPTSLTLVQHISQMAYCNANTTHSFTHVVQHSQ